LARSQLAKVIETGAHAAGDTEATEKLLSLGVEKLNFQAAKSRFHHPYIGRRRVRQLELNYARLALVSHLLVAHNLELRVIRQVSRRLRRGFLTTHENDNQRQEP
jgi:hypothetical protein